MGDLDYDYMAEQERAAESAVPAPEDTGPSVSASGLPMYSRDDSKYASNTMAALTRAEWDDYKTRFMPYESRLAELATTGNVGEQITKAGGLVDASFGQARQSQQEGLEMYGVSADQQTEAANSRGLSLAHAASRAGAENTVRVTNYDRQNELMAGTQVGGMKSIAGGN